MKSPSIHLKNVSVQFESRERAWGKKKHCWALRNIDLSLKEGDRVGILGENGAGKSTLLKVVGRIYPPTSGTVQISGKILSLLELGSGLSAELTGRENLFFQAALYQISTGKMKRDWDAILDFCELASVIDTPVKYYSAGMRLRLELAILFEASPEILILDEILSAMDPVFLKKAQPRLSGWIQNCKILARVSHDLEAIRQSCTRVLLLQKGVKVAEGPTEEILERWQFDINARREYLEGEETDGDPLY